MWLSIGHRLANTNRYQLTNCYWLISIDRLDFRWSISNDCSGRVCCWPPKKPKLEYLVFRLQCIYLYSLDVLAISLHHHSVSFFPGSFKILVLFSHIYPSSSSLVGLKKYIVHVNLTSLGDLKESIYLLFKGYPQLTFGMKCLQDLIFFLTSYSDSWILICYNKYHH